MGIQMSGILVRNDDKYRESGFICWQVEVLVTTFSYGVRNELNLVLVDSPNETVAPIMVKQLVDAPPKK